MVMADSPPSTLCFNIIDNVSSTFEIYFNIAGGTGRFEGATGHSITTGSSRNIFDGHSGFSGSNTGEIFLIKKSDKSKKSKKRKKSKNR